MASAVLPFTAYVARLVAGATMFALAVPLPYAWLGFATGRLLRLVVRPLTADRTGGRQ